MIHKSPISTSLIYSVLLLMAFGCSDSSTDADHSHHAGTHTHADGTVHTDHAPTATMDHGHDHGHDERPLPAAMIGEFSVELAQGHGPITAGQEGHLVIKLPYQDGGSTVVRAWIGTEDRTLSFVGKGVYAPSHDDYDLHAMAPDPLPAGVRWWIEIERPDGQRAVGSASPILE